MTVFSPFVRYSFRYLFLAPSGKKLLLLALVGLFLSSFSLLVLQATMGGLQHNLKKRSKNAVGHGEFVLFDQSDSFSQKIANALSQEGLLPLREYEIELLVRRKAYLSPLIVHGVEDSPKPPSFLEGLSAGGILMGADAAHKLKARPGDGLQFISPIHLDPVLGGIPRSVSDRIARLAVTEVPELDLFHAWVRDSKIHNLIQEVRYNKIRHYLGPSTKARKLAQKYPKKLLYFSWEEIHQSLVWALNLENTVMLALFIAMALLVSISISSGLFIFYQKIHREMIGFWIMGAGERQLIKSCRLFIHLLALSTCALAMIFALLFLESMDYWSPLLMPDIFVDQKIPVRVTFPHLLLSFLIPYGVAVLFSHLSLASFKRRHRHHLTHLRSFGQ
ncbi:MAG: hypothetical protein OXB88_02835 [Bacteriovoracales bacterium]|nr:hypothetical protein [Bacteriovoracales bacterium]